MGNRIVKLETRKDGVTDVELLESRVRGPGPGYYFQYRVASSRGRNRFNAEAFVRDSKLYVLTVQCREEDYESQEKIIDRIVDSFKLIGA